MSSVPVTSTSSLLQLSAAPMMKSNGSENTSLVGPAGAAKAQVESTATAITAKTKDNLDATFLFNTFPPRILSPLTRSWRIAYAQGGNLQQPLNRISTVSQTLECPRDQSASTSSGPTGSIPPTG